MQTTPRRTRRAGALALPALLALSAGLAGCEPRPDPIPATPPGEAAALEGEFASHAELLRAVKDGSYAERGDLPLEELAVPKLPEPVEVAFVSGTEPPEAELGALDALVERLRSDDGLSVDVIGCSDPSGSAALNRRISRQRAEAVAAALRARGAPERSIGEVVGRGEDCREQRRVVQVIPERAGS